MNEKIINRERQFCKRGHDTFIVGRTKQRGCRECGRQSERARYKLPQRRNQFRNNQWKRQGIKNLDGSVFTDKNFSVLYNEQNGKCGVCFKSQAELRTTLNVDHDHQTGLVRGLLCDSCNKNLGILENNKNFLVNVDAYLKKKIS